MSKPVAVLGIFVGGTGRRMGGVRKALLLSPGGAETLVARLVRVGREAGLEPVIVGDGEVGPDVASVLRVRDDPAGVGPLGGLGGLLGHAQGRGVAALAVACDMPHVSAALLGKLLGDARDAPVLAPRDPQSGKWQPLLARYDPLRTQPALATLLAAGGRSFQALLTQLACTELVLSDDEQGELRDWDVLEDIEP